MQAHILRYSFLDGLLRLWDFTYNVHEFGKHFCARNNETIVVTNKNDALGETKRSGPVTVGRYTNVNSALRVKHV
jgi:hypothetical protein